MNFLKVFIVASSITNWIEASHYIHNPDAIENNVYFEKLTWKIYDKTLITDVEVKIKKVAYNVLNFNVSLTAHRSYSELWIHIIVYYKYQEYQQYLVNIWVDVCKLSINPDDTPLGRMLKANLEPVWKDIYSSFDLLHYCPSPVGKVNIYSIKPLNISQVVLPLMKAGRYRIDFSMAGKQSGTHLGLVQIYASISDLRIWF